MTKLPLILVTGFLGSGKTSLLKNILADSPPDIRIAIVQNEFAPGKTDSVVLKASGRSFDLLEVNNGSVFCACQLDTFISRLKSFIDQFNPDLIVLEATGLADPVSMGQILQAPGVEKQVYLAGIWTIVDLKNFNRSLQFVSRVRQQIQMADLLLLNKIDLAEFDVSTKQKIHEWNPGAEMVKTQYGGFAGLTKKLNELVKQEDVTLSSSLSKEDHSPGRPDVGSAVIRTQKAIDPDQIKSFIKVYGKRIIRMKGFIRTSRQEILMIQLIFDQLTIHPVKFWTGASELIVMGQGITARWVMNEIMNSNK